MEGAGSYVVGEETALLASLQGFRGTVSARPPFPAERGYHGKPTVVHNVETLCNIPFIAAHGAEAYKALSPGATPGTKLVCLNDRFVRPGMYEVRFGTPVSEICDELGGGLVDGRSIKAVQIGGPLGGILPASKLDTPFDFDELAAEGCMVGHGGILAFDDRTDARALARHLLAFGAHESCGKCFPCRIGLQRAFEMVDRPGDLDRERLEALLETLELGSLCAHGGGMPAPIRSLIAHFPEELGVARGPEPTDDPYMRRPEERREDDPGDAGMKVEIDGQAVEVEPGTTILEAAQAAGRYVPTLCFDDRMAPFGACRVCMVGAEGAAGPLAACTTPCRDDMRVRHHRRDLAADRRRHRGAGAVRAARAARRAHRAGRRGAPLRDRRAALAGRAPPARSRPAPPLPGAAARAVHLVRALRARLRRDPGRVRAHGHRAAAFHSGITAGLDSGFVDSTCVSCGACADTCPTDAITEHTLLDMAAAYTGDGGTA